MIARIGDNIKLIGRWHELAGFSGVAVCESNDPHAVASWALNWNGILDLDVSLVYDDDETRAIGKKKLA